MEGFIYEFLGTTILIFLGTGVVANVSLNKTYGHGAGLIVIAFAWAIGVFTGVFVAAGQSGAHLNPAVTFAFAFLGKFSWAKVPAYLAGQMLGAMAGALLTWLSYKKQYDATPDANTIRGTFCNTPTIPSNQEPNPKQNQKYDNHNKHDSIDPNFSKENPISRLK